MILKSRLLINDKIQQDFKSDSNNKLSEQSDQQASPSNKTKITKRI